MKVLEAEATKLQAEDASKPRSSQRQDADEYVIPTASQADTGGKGQRQLCSCFNAARGCLKGLEGTFRHERVMGAAVKGKDSKGQGKDGQDGHLLVQTLGLKQKPKQLQRPRQLRTPRQQLRQGKQ